MTAQAAGFEDSNVVFVLMLTPSQAVDLFLGDLTRRSRSKSGRTADSYRRLLDQFTDHLAPSKDVTEITADDCRGFLDAHAAGRLPRQQRRRLSPGTQATNYSALNSFLEWLYQQGKIKANPLDRVSRPRRVASEDLDVTTVDTRDVPKLIAACRTDAERIAIAVLAYAGPRRNAVSLLRVKDYNREAGTIRFREKGSKSIEKPVPDELREVLEGAFARGTYKDPDGYLIPPEGPLSRRGERDDRVIWRIVKRVADRAGVEAHVHALRAAFATFYLESNPDDLVGLQALMGHRSIETTRTYLRKLDKRRAMERVRGLSWAGVGAGNADPAGLPLYAANRLEVSLAMGAGGFEPPSDEFLDALRPGSQQSAAEVEK